MRARRPKLFRRLYPRAELDLTPLHKEIIKTVFDFRFIDSHMLTLLFKDRLQPPRDPKRKPTGRQIQRLLFSLYHAGYLNRPKTQIYWRMIESGSRNMVYSLGNKGAKVLAKDFAIPRGKIDWQKESSVSTFFIAHALLVSRLRACLLLALRRRADVQLLQWRQDRSLKAPVELSETIRYSGREYETTKTVKVIPDAFFSLLKPNGKRSHFFVEAVNLTSSKAHLKKLRAYWQFWRQGKHTELLNIQSFRVLSVVKSDRNLENLRRVAKKADPKEEGSPMFLFISEGDLDLERPEKVFERVWLSPKDDTPVSIIE